MHKIAGTQRLAALKIDPETGLGCLNKTDVQQEVEEENNCAGETEVSS